MAKVKSNIKEESLNRTNFVLTFMFLEASKTTRRNFNKGAFKKSIYSMMKSLEVWANKFSVC